ncbi:MAG: hypothetical protein H0W78_17060 [Planctomycetes bacterium]|nr:hypothetical protein [Planctomycetota bacterium]
MPLVPQIFPIPAEPVPGRRSELFATLRRIDGWGSGAWREVYSAWRLRHCLLGIDDLEAGVSRDEDDRVAAFVVVIPDHALGRPGDAGRDAATCDWVLRRAWDEVISGAPLTVTTHRPGQAVRANNACLFNVPTPGQPPTLVLRLLVRLPMAGMCCDGKALMRFLRRLERFADGLCRRRARPTLERHRHAVAVQQALRAALDEHGLVAFVADGARLARAGDGTAMPGCRPWRTPTAERLTIRLGRLGTIRGLGIRRGVTAVAGAPYHGKSTLLAALAAGRDDHLPDDGRELVVADASVLAIQAEDGRRIKDTDLSRFFAKLPGNNSRRFSTTRASGATSMGASLVQGISAGSRLLLVDEDSAASNFLSIDPVMRRLLGIALNGITTLLDLLPALAAAGINSVLVAGSNHQSLLASDRVVLMQDYQPQDVTVRMRRLLPQTRRRGRPAGTTLPTRILADEADCLFGPRHFLRVDVTEPERPLVNDTALDLRRCGWDLDKALVRGALAAAAWCCRLAAGKPLTTSELKRRYEDFLATYGVRGLDPFDTALITVPPWQLVVTVLERLERPVIRS